MEVDVFNMEGEKIRTVELPAEIFEAPINIDLMHQAYVRQMANARLGTRSTKVRAEVRGGGRKPWRQKGTGRARQGSTNAAQWVGGGRVHTPRPRSFEQDMPRQMRRAALRSALSVKASENSIVIVENLRMQEPKTRLMAAVLKKLVNDSSALLLIPGRDDVFTPVARSADNLANAKVLNANYLNVRDLMGYDKLVLPLETLDTIQAYLG